MKYLFITHETSRSGAPMVVLHLLKWLHKHKPNLVVDVISLEGGVLESEFKANCRLYFNYASEMKQKPLSIIKKGLLYLGISKKQNLKEGFLTKLVKETYDVVYANTIITIPLGAQIKKKLPNSVFVTHVHELDVMIKKSLPNINDFTPIINQFIAPSHLVKTSLVDNWSIPEYKVRVVHECTEIETISKGKKKNQVFTVGASGLVHWRKGQDIFLQLARYVKAHYSNAEIQFVWVGRIPFKERLILEADIKKMELQDTVHFTGEIENPSHHYNNFDVFVMPSREDPFPLVCIEVGMLGKPIISFEQATGSNEIIAQGGGYIVPYLNIEAMADAVMTYYKDRSLIKAHGKINKKAFSKFTPDDVCPKIFETITLNLSSES